jgi:hypothetical protein
VTTTVEILCACGRWYDVPAIPVPGHDGLVVTTLAQDDCAGEFGWSLTHARSGLSILPLDHPERAPSAVEVVDRVLGQLDWTLSGDELVAVIPTGRVRQLNKAWAHAVGCVFSVPHLDVSEATAR